MEAAGPSAIGGTFFSLFLQAVARKQSEASAAALRIWCFLIKRIDIKNVKKCYFLLFTSSSWNLL
jgi:hypothetical protein